MQPDLRHTPDLTIARKIFVSMKFQASIHNPIIKIYFRIALKNIKQQRSLIYKKSMACVTKSIRVCGLLTSLLHIVLL